MLMCLDVGNSQIHGGVYQGEELKFQFRKNTSAGLSSDELGVFLRSVVRENQAEPSDIHKVSICSVVPHMDYSLKNACQRYFCKDVLFVRPGVKTGIRIKYSNPTEVGADRIVTALAAKQTYPDKNLLIVDFGTATTVDAVTKDGDYLGGAILGGAKMMVSALDTNTAKLPSVEIVKPQNSCGQSTVESIQSGLYWSTVGGIKEIIAQISKERFDGEQPLVLATGGLAKLFEGSGLFETYIAELALEGLRIVYHKNETVLFKKS